MDDPINMRFGMLTQVGPKNHVLDGGRQFFFWGGRSGIPL